MTVTGTGGGAVNGDFYAYLNHGLTGFAVLLNRVGVNSSNPLGYDDNGFNNVTFSDSASNGDVHSYRLTLFGNENTPIPPGGAPLTGVWAPDARNISPLSSGAVLAGAPHSAFLSSFDGLDPNGSWTLFISDVSSGGTARLESWGLSISAVPEPRSAAFVVAFGLLLGAFIRKRLAK